ncbi:MAG: MotA/TolQ/ExbB proton channel family protein, partial [Limisphaerales bacterium]
TKQGALGFISGLILDRGWVNYAETIFFGWGLGILILKVLKLKHQRSAMALDPLPDEIGRLIDRDNVGQFIDYLYEQIPTSLRDSMMVNRIRKGLELFEGRQVNSEVSSMMENQSGIDSTRISGSYSSVKLFIAIIPLFGFIGTVLGLSGAIGTFSTALGATGGDAAANMDNLMESLGGVTSGLGTAFDTTLLGLLYSITLMIPASALQKVEDDNLNHIDAYCTETLMPRLNDGSNAAGGDMSAFMDAMVIAFNHAQSQYLGGINKAAAMIEQQSQSLEARSVENQKQIKASFESSVSDLSTATKGSIDQMLKNAEASVGKLTGAMTNADKYIGELGTSIKTTSSHVGSLEKNSREQSKLFQDTMEKSIKGVQAESAKVLTETMKTAVSETSKALDGLVRPTSEKLNELAGSVDKASKYIEEMERKSSEQQERIQKTLQEAIEKTQKESGRVLEDSMKNAVERTQKALEDINRSAAKEISKMGATVQNASEQAGNLGKIAQDNQSKLNEAIRESMREMQAEASKSLNETMKPAIGEITKLGESVRTASEQAGNVGKVASENQAKLSEAISDSMRKLQDEAVKSLNETLRPAVDEVSKMGATITSATSQMSELSSSAKSSQEQISKAITETVGNLQKETVGATRDTLKSAGDSISTLSTAIQGITGHLETLAKQAQDQQSELKDAMASAVNGMQDEAKKSMSETMGAANDNIGKLSEGIASLNKVLGELGGKQINVQVEKKKGLFG